MRKTYQIALGVLGGVLLARLSGIIDPWTAGAFLIFGLIASMFASADSVGRDCGRTAAQGRFPGWPAFWFMSGPMLVGAFVFPPILAPLMSLGQRALLAPLTHGLLVASAIGATVPLVDWIVMRRYGPPAPGEPYSPAQRIVGTAITGSYMALFIGFCVLAFHYAGIASGLADRLVIGTGWVIVATSVVMGAIWIPTACQRAKRLL